MISKDPKPLVLVILDGWGINKNKEGNAVALAKTPVFDDLWSRYPHSELKASGSAVGLPKKQSGNSEAGHMNIGAGREIKQDAVVVNESIADRTFFKNPAFIQTIRSVKKNKSRLHLMGLLTGTQSAHANQSHLYSFLSLAKKEGLNEVYLHLFTDGRDSTPTAGLHYLKDLLKEIKRLGLGRIATITGRYYAMDRIKKWERTQAAYQNLTLGNGEQVQDVVQAVKNYYARGITDEFIPPTVIRKSPLILIDDKDGVIFFNLRTDRAKQITQAFVQERFKGFKRKKVLKDLCFSIMTEFGPELGEVLTAYPGRVHGHTLPVVIGKCSAYKQLYIAESEKFPHVTYFLNGGFSKVVDRERRMVIPSLAVKSYAQKPEMRAKELTSRIVKFLKNNSYNFIVVNYANPDMVGHTGDLKAAIVALEFLDQRLKELMRAVNKRRGTMVVTADHGNVEEMIDPKTKEVLTAHTANPVPFILASTSEGSLRLQKEGKLANITPTILDYLDLEKPKAMKEKSLIIA